MLLLSSPVNVIKKYFYFSLLPSPTWEKAFFFSSGWRSYFVLTFIIGMLVGWGCGRLNSLRSHLATFTQSYSWVLWKEGRYFSLCEEHLPACVSWTLFSVAFPFSLGNCVGKKFLSFRVLRPERAKSTWRFLLPQAAHPHI